MSLNPGMRLGPYEILGPLGAGGMGEVYRARDTRLDRTVAIKVLPEHLSDAPEVRARFEREAKAVSSLNHPHICVLYDVGNQDGVDYLVMECLEGETLAVRLERGAMPADELMRIGIQIADALDKAHRQGIIHRDLKPSNVMLTKSGAKLMDFGLARSTGLAPAVGTLSQSPTMSRPLTAEGAIVGTYQYMSPEVLEGREADARSDIFAFGAVLYEMATGKRAFEARSQASVIAAILERDPAPISSIQPMTPPALERLIKQCLVKDPDSRRQSMHDVLLELRWVAEGGSQAGVPAPVAARRRGRARLAWVVAGVAAAAAVVFGVGYFSHRPARTEQIRFLIGAPEGITFIDSPRISPDGRYVAFNMTDSTGVTRIWVRAMSSLAAQPLMGTEGAARPFWSPDSRFIGYMADNKLKKVAVTGGPSVTVCESGSRGDGAWGTGGVILFDGSAADSIARVTASGGVPSPATRLDRGRREIGNAWPEFLPDGKHFLFLAFGSRADSVAVKVGSIDSKDVKILAIGNYSRIDFAPPGYVLFVRDRALMAQPFDAKALKLTGEPFPVVDDVSAGGGGASNADFSVSDNGVLVCRGGVGSGNSRLVWLDRTGKALGTLGAAADYSTISLSPDGERVAAEIGQLGAGVDIWILDRIRGVTTRLTFDPGDDLWPVWSPDGTRITFGSNRAGNFGIYEKQSNGVGADDLVLKTADDVGPSDWSSDGRYLICLSSAPATRWDIWALPTFGDRKPTPFLKTQFADYEARLSPDGRWLAYSSSESGLREIYIQAFPDAGGKWQISTQGGRDPMWRRDGKELFYISPDGKMMSVDIAAAATLQAGVPKVLFEGVRSNENPLGRSYAVTADGQQFLVIRPDRARAIPSTTVVVNWMAGLGGK